VWLGRWDHRDLPECRVPRVQRGRRVCKVRQAHRVLRGMPGRRGLRVSMVQLEQRALRVPLVRRVCQGWCIKVLTSPRRRMGLAMWCSGVDRATRRWWLAMLDRHQARVR
jgi:hypothetical protein